MSDCEHTRGRAAATEAARRIVAHDPSPAPDQPTREMLARFFALVELLPRGEAVDGAVPREPDAPHAAKPRPPSPAAAPRRSERSPRFPRSVSVPTLALVALIAALIFVTVALVLPRDSFAPADAIYLSGTGAARGARGVLLLGDTGGLLFASGLSDLAPGYRYVAWEMLDNGLERIGTMVVLGGGRARMTVPALASGEQIEVTIEPSTATGAPEGPTVLAGFRLDE